ncbi:hypothetical protein BRC82_04160 [Halobacteriales archaeon QS_1_67_19]|nr:MAG: hypothetical protein BRC82_04160 [Halobacteriales archaeon QS_1_67_19]
MDDSPRVLLVDDSTAASTAATRLEQRCEAKVVLEASPSAALDRLRAEPIDCLVGEYELSEGNGPELLASVREIAPDLPFVVFTASGSEDVVSEAISAGATDYVRKAAGAEALAEAVESAVADRREASESRALRRRRLVERISDAFFAIDDDWRIQYVNERAASLFGRDREELIGEVLHEAFPEASGQPFAEAYREALETQESRTVEAEMSVNPGTWVEARAYPSPNGLSVYGRDVTDRKRTETELRETQRKIKSLYDVASRAISCSSAEEVHELAIAAAEDILEFDFCAVDVIEDGTLVSAAVSERVDDDGYYEATPLDANAAAAQAARRGESVLVDDLQAAGFTPAESEYRSALTVPLGEFGVFQAVSADRGGFDEDDRELTELLAAHLTEALRRIESEAALREERDRFAALFENVPNAVLSCVYEDGKPIVRAINPAFEETFGWDEAAVLDEPIDEYIVPEDATCEAEALNRRARSGAQIEGAEVRRRTADGQRDFLLNTVSVRQEPTVEDVSVYTDITDQKERERKLARQNERLEEFASVITHDLRNPLNVAKGRYDLLAEAVDSEHLEPLGRSPDPEPVDVETVAREAWATVETTDAELLVESEATVAADSGRLRQLFENLFRNAVDHAGPTAAIRVGDLDDGFYVADDGPGIPEGDREAVFEHGFTTADDGTGFGLAIVADIAAAHGWSIAVTEGSAGGARFEIEP